MSKRVHHKHQRRAATLIRAVQGRDEIRSEVTVPDSVLSIDFLIELTEPSEAWGILAGDLSHRAVVVEHFSRPPGPAELASCLAKLALIQRQWHLGSWRLGRHPLALVT